MSNIQTGHHHRDPCFQSQIKQSELGHVVTGEGNTFELEAKNLTLVGLLGRPATQPHDHICKLLQRVVIEVLSDRLLVLLKCESAFLLGRHAVEVVPELVGHALVLAVEDSETGAVLVEGDPELVAEVPFLHLVHLARQLLIRREICVQAADTWHISLDCEFSSLCDAAAHDVFSESSVDEALILGGNGCY